MKKLVLFAVLTYSLGATANDCVTRALEKAKGVDGAAAGTTGSGGKVSEGMDHPAGGGRKLTLEEAKLANDRAKAAEAVLGRELTSEEATLLLGSKDFKVLGKDKALYDKYKKELENPGSASREAAAEAAKAAAEASKAEAARVAAEKAEATRQANEAARLKREATAAAEKEARELANNPYYIKNQKDLKDYRPPRDLFDTSESAMTPMQAKNAITNLGTAKTLESGIDRAILEYGTRLKQLEKALSTTDSEVIQKKLSDEMNALKSRCYNFQKMALKATNSQSLHSKVNNFVSGNCGY